MRLPYHVYDGSTRLASEAANGLSLFRGVPALIGGAECTVVHLRTHRCIGQWTNNVTVFSCRCMLWDLYMSVLMPFS